MRIFVNSAVMQVDWPGMISVNTIQTCSQ